MSNRIIIIISLSILHLIFGCCSTENSSALPTTVSQLNNYNNHSLSIDYKRIILSPPYGWKQEDNEYYLEFIEDGTVNIQGNDGEASLWKGSWKFEGSLLVVDNSDLGTRESYRISIDGNNIILNSKTFVPVQ